MRSGGRGGGHERATRAETRRSRGNVEPPPGGVERAASENGTGRLTRSRPPGPGRSESRRGETRLDELRFANERCKRRRRDSVRCANPRLPPGPAGAFVRHGPRGASPPARPRSGAARRAGGSPSPWRWGLPRGRDRSAPGRRAPGCPSHPFAQRPPATRPRPFPPRQPTAAASRQRMPTVSRWAWPSTAACTRIGIRRRGRWSWPSSSGSLRRTRSSGRRSSGSRGTSTSVESTRS